MQKNEVNFKALTFISEQTASTFNYEVKAVRALWDPSLSIPGTNRRGGWRCPVGTRYGGQITDRFGRSCGWGVARRIANQIADIGERLENVDDRKRNNRLAKRNARMQRLLARQQKPGLLERGARGVAQALEGGQTPQQRPRVPVQRPRPLGGMIDPNTGRVVNLPDNPAIERAREVIERTPVAPRRRRGNLRESEQRRMERELVEPGAPRTGEPPKPNRPRGRRRAATQQGAKRTVRRKPEADFVDGVKPVPTVVPQRKPPSAPPKPIVVEPDPNFNAPDLGGSLPDARSERNVRNRFRERGLPDTAYWRDEDFPEGGGKAELERRFGRYYGEDNKRNARGDYVNRKITREANPPAQPRSQPPQPPARVEPPAPAQRVGPPPIRRVLDVDGEFNKPEDQLFKDLVNADLNNFEPNAYNNLRGLTRDQLQAKKEQLKQEQDQGLDDQFNIQLAFWFQEKNKGENAREAARSMLINAHLNRERNKLEQEAVNMRIIEMDAGIEWRQKLPKQLSANQAPRAQPPQPPARPQTPVSPSVSTASEIIPDDKIVPDSDAGGKAPRRIGRAQKLDDAVKALHENQGNLADIPDGIVIDAVIDGEFKDVGANKVLTDAEVASELKNGFHQRPIGSKFENRRYKFEVMKNAAGIADVWVVLEVEDKISGEKWFMKSSTFGDNDALLENVGMNAAQALEFGNNENHLRIGEILQNDRRVNGAPPKPRRWIMMKDIAQWQNGVQGNWKDAKDGLDRVAAEINPRDVGRILALDMVLDNQDRHGGNFMWVKEGNRVRLGLIDHGLIGGGRQDNTLDREAWARRIIANPGAGAYSVETNNGIEGLRGAGYRVQNQRDARILKETLKRSVARLKRDLDKITGGERIEANGAKLSDAEKAHLALVKSVAEARIGWMENNLDAIVDTLR
jgi:hypothetical protein